MPHNPISWWRHHRAARDARREAPHALSESTERYFRLNQQQREVVDALVAFTQASTCQEITIGLEAEAIDFELSQLDDDQWAFLDRFVDQVRTRQVPAARQQ